MLDYGASLTFRNNLELFSVQPSAPWKAICFLLQHLQYKAFCLARLLTVSLASETSYCVVKARSIICANGRDQGYGVPPAASDRAARSKRVIEREPGM